MPDKRVFMDSNGKFYKAINAHSPNDCSYLPQSNEFMDALPDDETGISDSQHNAQIQINMSDPAIEAAEELEGDPQA